MICAILSVLIQLLCCCYQGPEGQNWPYYKKPCTMFNYTPGWLLVSDMVMTFSELKVMSITASVIPVGQERVTALTTHSASRGSGQCQW